MKNEAIDKAVDKLLEAEDYDTRMVRKFGGDGDNIEGLRSRSLRNNFDEVADDFLEQYGVEEVEEEEFVKLATTLDSMGEEAVDKLLDEENSRAKLDKIVQQGLKLLPKNDGRVDHTVDDLWQKYETELSKDDWDYVVTKLEKLAKGSKKKYDKDVKGGKTDQFSPDAVKGVMKELGVK